MHGFVARENSRRTAQGTEVAAGFDPSLDGAVILFDHVVEIFDRPVLTASRQYSLLLERLDGGWVARVLVRVDDAWYWVILASEHLLQEALGCDGVTLLRK